MERRFESILFKGFVDRDLRVTFLFTLRLEGKYASITENEENGSIHTYPSYILSLKAFGSNTCIFIPSSKYFTFVVLLDKTIKLIQENLFDLFPSINKIEFDMNDSVLERFQKEKALSSGNITLVPDIFTDKTGVCSPAIRISLEDKSGVLIIPLEDAIGINQMFKTFDPNQYQLSIMSQLIKIT